MRQCTGCRWLFPEEELGDRGRCRACYPVFGLLRSIHDDYRGMGLFLDDPKRLARIELYAERAERELPLFNTEDEHVSSGTETGREDSCGTAPHNQTTHRPFDDLILLRPSSTGRLSSIARPSLNRTSLLSPPRLDRDLTMARVTE